MNKKLFTLIIALSIVALPITAQEIENAQEQKTQSADYKKGYINGALASLAASSFIFGTYIATTVKNGIYIPKWLFVPSAPKTVFTPKPWGDPTKLNHEVSLPQYSKEKNPLHDWFLAEKSMPQEQFSILRPNLTNTIAIACVATAFGALCYWSCRIHATKNSDADAASGA